MYAASVELCTSQAFLPVNPEFEYNGLQWAGVRLENNALLTAIARKSTGCLMERVRIVGRDDSPCGLITESSREFEEHGKGVAL